MSNELKAPVAGSENDAATAVSQAVAEEERAADGDQKAARGGGGASAPAGAQGKAEEYFDRLVRLTADFDNYKKRVAREKQEAIRYANESLLEKLIPALDNFDMALTAANQKASIESLITGVQMVYNQLKAALAEAGLEEIDAANQPFNPNWHQAVAQQESQTAPDGAVLQQLRKGYKLRDRLLRPATVVVAKNPAG